MTTDLRLVPAALAAWATAWGLTSALGPSALESAVMVATVAPLVAGVVAVVQRGSIATQALLVLGTVVAIALSVQLHADRQAGVVALAQQRAEAVFAGRVVSDSRQGAFGAGETWLLDVDAVTARAVTTSTRARVEVTTMAPAPPYGARVVVEAGLSPVRPGATQAARASGTVAEVVRAPPAALRTTNAMRSALLDVTADLSPQARGLVPGIAVGDTSRLPEELADAFQVTGLTHLTAVSGGHFAIVLALVTALVGIARAPRWLRVLLVAGIAVGFVLLVRPDPSVQRAAAMCAVALLGITLGRPAASVPPLAAAMIVLLALDPTLARSFGFVLSCAATAGLVLLAPPLMRRLTPWLGRTAAFAVAVPVAAQLACGPVLLLLSPSVPTTSVLANLLAAPAVVPATLLGLAATITAPWAPAFAHALAWLAGSATWWIAAVARWCAGLPGASLPWPGGVPGALALAAATSAGLVLVLRRGPAAGWPISWTDAGRRRWRAVGREGKAAVARFRFGVATRRDRRLALAALAAVALFVAGTTTVVLRAAAPPGDVPTDWQVVACDVGQGDSLVVRTGPAAAIVVDVGPEGDAAGRCLDRLGVTRIDLLVLSHDHLDHVGGLAAVLAGREVDAAWVSPLDEPAANARRLRDELAAAGVTPHVPDVGERGTVGAGPWQVVVDVLGTGVTGAAGAERRAVSSGSAEGDGVNDSSLSVAFTSSGTGGTVEVVALGDLEEPGQDALRASLRSGVPAGVADGVDVVKVAHHGSASQSEGLARLLDPVVALVSVGKDNTYGHPTDRMLDLYEGVGAQVVRTDECDTAVLVVRKGDFALGCG